jgi:hypothetical protein
VNWKFILLCACFSVAFWQLVENIASPRTAQRIHRAAGIVSKWLLVIFVVGGVIGLLNLGWEHLTK